MTRAHAAPSARAGRRAAAAMAAALIAATCAARAPTRPGGAASADPAAVDALVAATRHCGGLQTLSAELRAAGRVGGERVRARLLAGFAAPGALRLEAVAPFGPPGFILAGRGNRAALLLPRERRIVEDAPVAELLDALAGLALDADALRHVLAGCPPGGSPRDGQRHAGGWLSVTLGAGARAYLRASGGQVRVTAADFDGWQVDYEAHAGAAPRRVRLRHAAGVDVAVEVASLEINTPIEDRAFAVEAEPGVARITLDELRAASPLRAHDP